MTASFLIWLLLILFILLFIWLLMNYRLLLFWIIARAGDLKVSVSRLREIKRSGVDPGIIIPACLEATKAGIGLDIDTLVNLGRNGQNVRNIVHGLIFSQGKGLSLSLKEAVEMDKKGIDIINKLNNK